MRGPGSGRHWGCWGATVEDGLTLDISKLVRDRNIRPGKWLSGTLRWRRVASGEEVASIGYEVATQGTEACATKAATIHRTGGFSG